MIGFEAPLWLMPLLALPLIWWLHQSGGGVAQITVSALFPWPAAPPGAAGSTRTTTDPAWLLRAAVVATLLLAASRPWIAGEPRVVVWFDDTLSMGALDDGRSRAASAVERVDRALGGRTAQWRSLSGHAPVEGADPLASIERRIPEEYSLRAPGLLDPDAEHWLVTDGADPTANELAASRQFSRVIVVGSATENSAIVRIGLRRAPGAATEAVGFVRVVNSGGAAATRSLEILANDETLLRHTLDIPASGTLDIPFRMTATSPGQEVTANLSPPDILALDDTLSVNSAALRAATVVMSDACGPRLAHALASHRGIHLVETRNPELAVTCGAETNETGALGAVHFRSQGFTRRTSGLAMWNETARATAPYVHGQFAIVPAAPGRPATPLLSDAASGDILITAEPGLVAVHIDVSDTPADDAAFLDLVTNILENAAGRRLLDPRAERVRPTAETRIASLTPTIRTRERGPVDQPFEATSVLLALALLLVASDLMLTRRRQGANADGALRPANDPARDTHLQDQA